MDKKNRNYNDIQNGYEMWLKKYKSEKFIEIFKYFNADDLKKLEKLGIFIKNKLYTEYEYDCIETELLKYYNELEKVEEKNISQESFNILLEKFNNIRSNYNF